MSRATEKYKKTKEWKLQNERDKYKYKCCCGATVHIYPIKNKDGSVICGWCKRRVYANPEEQKKAVERYKKENFRMIMYKKLKGVK